MGDAKVAFMLQEPRAEFRVRRRNPQAAEAHETPGTASRIGANRILKESRARGFPRQRVLGSSFEQAFESPVRFASW